MYGYEHKGWTPDLLAFHPELRNSSYIDVFVEGETSATWTATPSEPWIRGSRRSGSFSSNSRHLEDRLEVSLDWGAILQTGEGLVTIQCSTARQPIGIRVHAAPHETKNASFIEANRIVSIYAIYTDDHSPGWEVLQGLGHTGADLRALLEMKPVNAADQAAILKVPKAVYRFVTTTADDKATLRLFALPTFPITSENGVRIAVSIDEGPLKLIDFFAPEFSEAWREHAMTNTAIETLPDLHLKPGDHTLTIYALDPGVTLDRFEVAFTGAHEAYLPVPETRILH